MDLKGMYAKYKLLIGVVVGTLLGHFGLDAKCYQEFGDTIQYPTTQTAPAE